MIIPAPLREAGLKRGDLRLAILSAIEDNLTEEATDALIAKLDEWLAEQKKLPWYFPRALVRHLLDAILPDLLIRGFHEVIQ